MTIQDLRGKPASGIDWKARAEAAEKDAARYRFLRDTTSMDGSEYDLWRWLGSSASEMDGAIDAAMERAALPRNIVAPGT